MHAYLVMPNSFAIPLTVAHQAPLSMGFSRQEYWSGLPFPSPGDLPHPGIKPMPLALACRFFTIEPPGKPIIENTEGINLQGIMDRKQGRWIKFL